MSAQEIMKKAKQQAASNLRECALELVEYQNTAVLPDGHVRAISSLLKPIDAHNSLTIAQSIVTNLCVAQVANT